MWALKAKGADIIFTCMRPAIVIYVAASCVEQIHYSCLNCDIDVWDTAYIAKNMAIFGKSLMAFAGFWQSLSMRNKSDIPFVVAVIGGLICILFTNAPNATGGPYCTIPNIEKIWNRLAQAIAFAWLYAVHVYTYTFNSKDSGEMIVCVARATVCSIWILSSETTYFLISIPQSIVCIIMRTRMDVDHLPMESCYVECLQTDAPSRSVSPDAYRKN